MGTMHDARRVAKGGEAEVVMAAVAAVALALTMLR